MNRRKNMNINRDYIVKLFMAEAGANRGKVIAPPISFYTSDKHTQNIFLEVDQSITDIDKVEMVYSAGEIEHRVAGVKLDDKLVEFNLDYKALLPGRYRAVIMLSKGDEVLTSEMFTFTVEKSLFAEFMKYCDEQDKAEFPFLGGE